MNIFAGIKDLLTGGGIVGKIVDTVKDYFPPSMSEQEKAAAQMAMLQAGREHEMALLDFAHRQDVEFNARIKDLEGTAADLRGVWLFGPLIIFLRGCQRPLWGFGTLFIDWQVFSGAWRLRFQGDAGWTPEGIALVAINLLVLGFLFGERAIKNVMPLVTRLFEARAGGGSQ